MKAAFLEIQPKLEQVAKRFAARYHGDADELTAVTYEAFVDAEANWEIDYSRAWKTFVCNKAWWRMGTHGRLEASWNQRHGGELPGDVPERPERSTGSLLASLSADAETVCRLVLETPAELIEALAAGEPYRCRVSLRNWLQGLGWTAERVVEAFQELREALS